MSGHTGTFVFNQDNPTGKRCRESNLHPYIKRYVGAIAVVFMDGNVTELDLFTYILRINLYNEMTW